MKLYHGTSARHLEKILKHGIKPRGKKKGNWGHTVHSHPNAVYLTTAYPLYYALTATKPKDLHEQGVILEIDINKLNPFKLAPDEDFMAQATHRAAKFAGKSLLEVTEFYRNILERYSQHWDLSLKSMGNCCYLDTVPPDAITRYALIGNPISWLAYSDPVVGIANFSILGPYYQALSKSLFGDPVEYKSTDSIYQLPSKDDLAKIKVVNHRR